MHSFLKRLVLKSGGGPQRTNLLELPTEILLMILFQILKTNEIKDFENLVKAYPVLNRFIVVVNDTQWTPYDTAYSCKEKEGPWDGSMFINLPHSHHTTLREYSFLSMEYRSSKPIKIFCYRYCDEENLFRMNVTSGCEYARHLAYDTCVLYSCDQNSAHLRQQLQQHCARSNVPVLREVANKDFGKTCLRDRDLHLNTVVQQNTYTRLNITNFATMTRDATPVPLEDRGLKILNVDFKECPNNLFTPAVHLNAGCLKTLTVSFSGAVAPIFNMKGTNPYGRVIDLSNLYTGLDNSHLMITNTNWSTENPYGRLAESYKEDPADCQAFHCITERHRALPQYPSFRSVFLEGLPTQMVPLIYWPYVTNFYWKRLCPKTSSRSSRIVNTHGPDYLKVKAPRLEKIKIFSVIERDQVPDVDLPQFTEDCGRLKSLTLVSLNDSTGKWDINNILDHTQKNRLTQVSLACFDKAFTPVLDANDVHLFQECVQELLIWGHTAGFIESFVPETGAVFKSLKVLVLDLSSVPLEQHPIDHVEEFKHSESQIGGSSCTAKLTLRQAQFPQLQSLRLVSPDGRIALFGSGVDISLTLPRKCKTVTISDVIPAHTIVCNGIVTKVRTYTIPRARSHTVWKRSCLTGRFYKEKRTQEKVYTFEEWLLQYQSNQAG